MCAPGYATPLPSRRGQLSSGYRGTPPYESSTWYPRSGRSGRWLRAGGTPTNLNGRMPSGMSRRSRIRFGGNNRYFPVWTPEGDQVAFSDGPTGTNTLYLVAADGSEKIVALLERDGLQFLTSSSRDGSVLALPRNQP